MRPIVQYLIVCDDVRPDPSNPLRVNAFGLIINIRPSAVPPFPVIRPHLCVLVLMTRCQGVGDLSIRIVHNATGQSAFFNSPRRIRFVGSPRDAVGVTFRVRNCAFPEAGVYWVEVIYDGTVIARRPLVVHE